MDIEFEQDLEGFMSNALEESWDKFNSEVHEQLPFDFSTPQGQVQNDLVCEQQLLGFIKSENEEQIFHDIAFPNSMTSNNHLYNKNINNNNINNNSMHNNIQFDDDWMQLIDLMEPAQSLEQLADMSSCNNSSRDLRMKLEIQHSRSYSAPMAMAKPCCFREMKYDTPNTYSPILLNTPLPQNLFQYDNGFADGLSMLNTIDIQSQTHRRATSDVLPQFRDYGQGGQMDMQIEQMCYKSMHSRSNTYCSDDPSQQTLINNNTISEERAFYQEHQLVPIMDAGIKEYAPLKDQQFMKTESPTSVIFPVCSQSMPEKVQKNKRGLGDMSPRSRRRVMANRESAKKSRDRKEKYKHDMELENLVLDKAIQVVGEDMQHSTQNLQLLKKENTALRYKILELQKLYQINELVLQQQFNKK
eukprot:TRINITY_DN3218_c0_g1_i4.p1 TRINITY_DN3218_c0_g1~~TRINITY_DN3218_c0_g1_i4.p1  ORF type:complete len:415 (-),score=53.11 TRINITY_DN3218_c0_g1_i4:850-2094(-)